MNRINIADFKNLNTDSIIKMSTIFQSNSRICLLIKNQFVDHFTVCNGVHTVLEPNYDELANPFMHFNVIRDYRRKGKVANKLMDIILLTMCAVLSVQDDWQGIYHFGENCIDFLKRFGDFSAGLPPASTIACVMGVINPAQLQN